MGDNEHDNGHYHVSRIPPQVSEPGVTLSGSAPGCQLKLINLEDTKRCSIFSKYL